MSDKNIIVDDPIVGVGNYLRRLGVVSLGPTFGNDNYISAKKVFKAGFDPDFKNWGIVFSGIAPKTNIDVDKLVEDGKYWDFLGNTPEELEHRRMLGSQWLKFCQDHPDKLCKGGKATFTVLTKQDEKVAADLGNVFVALVFVVDGAQLGAAVHHIDFNFTLHAQNRHRILYPQR